MSWKTKALFGLAFAACASFVTFVIWWSAWVNYVPQNDIGFAFNKMTGQVEVLEKTGYVVATPWVKDVHSIDLRPQQVCMNANNRVLNCKLVKFNPYGANGDKASKLGLNTFIEWHGVSAGDNGGVYEILKSYAFNVNDGTDCPFLSIVDDMRRKESAPSANGS